MANQNTVLKDFSLKQTQSVISCNELLTKHFEDNNILGESKKLKFHGVDGMDCYNPSKPFSSAGKTIMAVRVEPREDGLASNTMFFEDLGNDEWKLIEDAPVFKMQDPCVCFINGLLVVGGIVVVFDENGGCGGWYMDFYKGKDIYSLEKFVTGPMCMKDIRFAQLENSKIGIFTRPHGLPDAHAKIGFIKADSFEEITTEFIAGATNFNDQFLPKEWGGANEIIPLNNGLLGVVGHIAQMTDAEIRHYYSMVFLLNPNTMEKSEIKIIACRDDFVKGSTKEDILADVLFTGGLEVNEDGTATLYTGVSDAETHKILIKNPFMGL